MEKWVYWIFLTTAITLLGKSTASTHLFRQKREGFDEAMGVAVNAALKASDFFQQGVAFGDSGKKEVEFFGAKADFGGDSKIGFGDAVRKPAADDDDDRRRRKRSPCSGKQGGGTGGGTGGTGGGGGTGIGSNPETGQIRRLKRMAYPGIQPNEGYNSYEDIESTRYKRKAQGGRGQGGQGRQSGLGEQGKPGGQGEPGGQSVQGGQSGPGGQEGQSGQISGGSKGNQQRGIRQKRMAQNDDDDQQEQGPGRQGPPHHHHGPHHHGHGHGPPPPCRGPPPSNEDNPDEQEGNNMDEEQPQQEQYRKRRQTNEQHEAAEKARNEFFQGIKKMKEEASDFIEKIFKLFDPKQQQQQPNAMS